MAVSSKDDYFIPNRIYDIKVYYYNLAATFDIDWLLIEILIVLISHSIFIYYIMSTNDSNTFYYYAGIL